MIVTFLKEFEHFLRSHKQWWCHFDDDNYVNVAALLDTLDKYEADKPWYLGKTSTASPLKIVHPKAGSVRELHVILQYLKHLFFCNIFQQNSSFATCICICILNISPSRIPPSGLPLAELASVFLERSPFGWHHLPLMEDLYRSNICLLVLYCSIWGKIMSNLCHFVILCCCAGW